MANNNDFNLLLAPGVDGYKHAINHLESQFIPMYMQYLRAQPVAAAPGVPAAVADNNALIISQSYPHQIEQLLQDLQSRLNLAIPLAVPITGLSTSESRDLTLIIARLRILLNLWQVVAIPASAIASRIAMDGAAPPFHGQMFGGSKKGSKKSSKKGSKKRTKKSYKK